ncbi:hypothetical protein Ahy_B01g055061 [Arachis hypogaea]|uniref:IBH1-like N-terminal domain-containing protein n=1 Tax=Arachis hypogaea TaxID=3818 RepID=A0A445AV31_ARAHY|nr:hypothetical protein Ahy_B01g055061 [Arachis hypogaea]
MEGNAAGNKRRRVYSVEAKKVAQSAFTRNYVNYLIPALTKIKNQNSTTTSSDFKNVKYEVDMAMAFSAQGPFKNGPELGFNDAMSAAGKCAAWRNENQKVDEEVS